MSLTMVAESTLVRDVSARIGLAEDQLIRDSIAAYLRERKRLLMAEQFEILARYGATSAGEVKSKIEKGEIHDHPAWEDYIELTNLAEELQNTEHVIRSFVRPE